MLSCPYSPRGSTTVDSAGNEVKVFDTVETELVYDEPDYSYIKATAGKDVPEMRAIFVPYTDLDSENAENLYRPPQARQRAPAGDEAAQQARSCGIRRQKWR